MDALGRVEGRIHFEEDTPTKVDRRDQPRVIAG